jgi:ATP-binding cassette subfamily C (CFTR/MRP) protein 1
MYDIRLHRLNVMSRIAIVGLVHNRCLNIQDGVFDDAAAVTLISDDVEQTMFSSDLFHELWSQSLELCIGMYLLSKELGWVCIVPILVVARTLLLPILLSVCRLSDSSQSLPREVSSSLSDSQIGKRL